MAIKVLIVDDQENQREILKEILVAEGDMLVFQAGNANEALSIIQEHMPAVVITDLKMPGKSGLSLLEEVSSLPMPPEVIVVTAFGSIQTAIKATRLGAYDYVTKPVKPEELLFLIKKACEKFLLRQETRMLKQQLTEQASESLIAHSKSMKDLLHIIAMVAPTDSTILIRGETGTGKERVARLIHLKSRRSPMPLRCINCAAFSESLLDSELFGYEKGAFTGAHARKIGIIEAAAGGTLFLDEVADMSQNTQAKMLRTLQEKTIRRVGGTEDVAIDIRIIAATNKNLEEAVNAGTFRPDLFYRLNIVPVSIPPLRERKEDIPFLANHFLKRYGQPKCVEEQAMQALLHYAWPGNVRELEAAMERVSVFSQGKTVSLSDLPSEICKSPVLLGSGPWEIPEQGLVFEDLERDLLSKALLKTNNNMAAAAKLLGMSYRAFRYRANVFGLRTE